MRRRRTTILAAALLLVLLAACGAGSPAAVGAPGGNQGEGAPPDAFDRSGGNPPTVTDGGDLPVAIADLADRKIVKTGEITLEVGNIGGAVGTVRAMALQLGGYVGGSSAGDAEQSATLTLRIPADRFDDAIDRLHAMDATVLAEATREEDVTSSIVDLEARIKNLEASEAQYRALVERAEKIDDILSVQGRLDDVRGQIEQLKAQLEQLSGLANLSTLTVTLTPTDKLVEETAAGWDAGDTLDRALAALVTLGQGLATVAIWLGVVGLPILIGLAILGLVGIRLRPRLPRRRPSEPPA
jgi:Domain of unknown function (DUF4349)